ncbi:MAG: formate hydrogenlyase [Negativicutes bacterium]|jgi:Ni,Fe-hydrogenase III small subunit
MFKKIIKIFKNSKTINRSDFDFARNVEFETSGEKLHTQIKNLFSGSLAIRQIDAGSDNSCEQELVALSNSYYDIERFGISFVASPRHADMLLVTGPVTRNMAEALKIAYEATPNPKIVVAVGDDAIDGGLFSDSYAVSGRVDSVVPVDYQIPGDPPAPMVIVEHLLRIMESYSLKQISARVGSEL